MKFGILNDLHLGHSGIGHWHNQLLFDDATAITQAAIRVLNAQQPDAIFVLGDVTQAGLPQQLALARDVLAAFTAPWYVLPGNHDRSAARSSLFDEVFRENLIAPYMRLGGVGIASLREQVPPDSNGESRYSLDAEWATKATQGIASDCPGALVVLSHFPLLDERLWADQHNGKDAGTLLHGEVQVSRLLDAIPPACAAYDRRALLLSGHEHWHHISIGSRWVQCVTAALIEYPMEIRVIVVDGGEIAIQTLSADVEVVASQSLLSSAEPAAWVRGREQDRDVRLTINQKKGG